MWKRVRMRPEPTKTGLSETGCQTVQELKMNGTVGVGYGPPINNRENWRGGEQRIRLTGWFVRSVNAESIGDVLAHWHGRIRYSATATATTTTLVIDVSKEHLVEVERKYFTRKLSSGVFETYNAYGTCIRYLEANLPIVASTVRTMLSSLSSIEYKEQRSHHTLKHDGQQDRQ